MKNTLCALAFLIATSAAAQTWDAPGACVTAEPIIDAGGTILAVSGLPYPVRCPPEPNTLAAPCSVLVVGSCADFSGRFAPADSDNPGELVLERLCFDNGAPGGSSPHGDGDGGGGEDPPPEDPPAAGRSTTTSGAVLSIVGLTFAALASWE